MSSASTLRRSKDAVGARSPSLAGKVTLRTPDHGIEKSASVITQ